MRYSQEYVKDTDAYKKEVTAMKKDLPRNWVKIVTDKYADLSRKEYTKLYNDLVSIMNGRSYRLYLERQDLMSEVLKLLNNKL